MARIVWLGEGMLELSRDAIGWRFGYGGDALNTAIHLVRAEHHVSYMTALGADPFSEQLRDRSQAEGLDCAFVGAHPVSQAGL